MAAQSLGGLSLQGSRKGKLCFSGAFCIVEARPAFNFTIRETESGENGLASWQTLRLFHQMQRIATQKSSCQGPPAHESWEQVFRERQTLGPC